MNTPVKTKGILDCHAHCLPGVDDGAADVTISIAMLNEAGRQGVSTVVATPHFYPGRMDVAEFLQHREEALTMLLPRLPAEAPRLLCGAEVLVREGVSRLDLRPLCITGTNCLLVELPFMSPPYWLAEELENIAFGQHVRLIIAHVDRYMTWYSHESIAEMTNFSDLILQLNGETMLDRRRFAHLRRWLPKGNGLLLGSDMHNMDTRAPNLKRAMAAMHRHRVGRQWLAQVENTAPILFDT